MGMMDSWRKWSEKQWALWGSKLQSKYDKYRALKTPEWYLKLTDKIWNELDDKAKDFLNKFVTEAVKRFDEKFAQELIDKIVASFKKRLSI